MPWTRCWFSWSLLIKETPAAYGIPSWIIGCTNSWRLFSERCVWGNCARDTAPKYHHRVARQIGTRPSATTMLTRLWLYSWWRHQMETFSALLALCAGNSPVTGEFPSQRPVTRSFDVFFDLGLNQPLSKQSRGWSFETPSCSLWRHCNVPYGLYYAAYVSHTYIPGSWNGRQYDAFWGRDGLLISITLHIKSYFVQLSTLPLKPRAACDLHLKYMHLIIMIFS